MTQEKKWVALVGNPNSGKSSLFNALTGLRQKVGNFPGVTVDKKTGFFEGEEGERVDLIDLPGLYSLYPNSKDEKMVLELLLNPDHPFQPEKIVYVVDPLQMERHLLLATQLVDLGFPMVLVINMIDIASENNIEIDIKRLSRELGIQVVAVSARTGENIQELKTLIQQDFKRRRKSPIVELNQYNARTATEVANLLSPKLLDIPFGIERAFHVAHHYTWLQGIDKKRVESLESFLKNARFDSLDEQVHDTMSRYSFITPLVRSVVKKKEKKTGGFTDKVDGIITNSFFGPVIFFGIMALVFQALFAWASVPADWIDALFGTAGGAIQFALGEGWLSGLLVDGILAGIGGVAVFIPQIFLLFLLLGVLEEVGYMSRAVYMFDNVLQRFGLNGRSIVALVSGGACAIPAIMSTRTISNWKERLTTIMVTPLISCSARIPVYIVLVGFVVPADQKWGFFNLQGLVFFGLYVLSIISALVSAWVFKKVLKTGEKSMLMIELPLYKKPIWKNVMINLREKLWAFVWEAGKVIFFISIILWFLASYGPKEQMKQAEVETEIYALTNNFTPEQTQNLLAARKIEASYAGHMGKFIEPVIKPLGFDWKIGIALITSFAAREVFVGTMATIYAIGSSDDEGTIRERMGKEINQETGEKVYTPAVAMSLLVFYLFAMQCMSTLAITKRETNTWKWPIIQFVYMTALAYLGSLFVFQVFG